MIMVLVCGPLRGEVDGATRLSVETSAHSVPLLVESTVKNVAR
jgi:hypothetical protein